MTASSAEPLFQRTPLDQGWLIRPGHEAAARPVTLPHDAMIEEPRDPRARSGPASGFYPGGSYTYSRTLQVPREWRDKHVSLLFEGSYRRTTVLINGVPIGYRPSGYAEFVVELTEHLVPGQDAELQVVVDNTKQPDARWYSGSGLYRRVWLQVEGSTRIARDGVRFRTLSVGSTAEVEVEVTPINDAGAPVEIAVELRRGGHRITGATTTCLSRTTTTIPLTVESPELWSADQPALYELVVWLEGGVAAVERVGIRVVTASAAEGLQVNGVSTKLRGGCLHHDSGVLGAATFRDAEFRRVRILKNVGFNAVRAGHSPISRDLLDACDELGMYVMDELTDVWFKPKSPHDSGRDFPAWWREDLASMIAKDRNHPSVILYSIGNENGETATDEGIAVAREMVASCHASDPTRLVTAGINPFLNALASVGIGLLNMDKEIEPEDVPKLANSTLINHLMNALNDRILTRPRLPRFDTATRGVFAELDVAGYNYGVGQYELHARRHPDRVMVGTETNPKDIVRNWGLVVKHPFLIGDFMWTAWDYLGEAGIGSWTYGDNRIGLIKPYPWLTADCGAVDLIGTVTAAGLLARAAWGDEHPSIVVRPPELVGLKKVRSNWRGTDAIASWSWPGFEDRRTEVLVYSAAEEIELHLNGRLIGRRPAGSRHGCTAVFTVPYEQGELTAIAFSAGSEVGRHSIRSCETELRLALAPDRSQLRADGQNLAFVRVQLVDGQGTVAQFSNDALVARVEGAAVLAGFGSADPKPSSGFMDGTSRLFHGECLAVLRAGSEAGQATLVVSSEAFGEVRLTLDVTL